MVNPWSRVQVKVKVKDKVHTLEDIELKIFEWELRMCPDKTPQEKFAEYLERRSSATMKQMLQYVGLYISDL